jgi:hypothetical protein
VKRNSQMGRHAAVIQMVTENLRSGFNRKLLKTDGDGPPRPLRETFLEQLRYRGGTGTRIRRFRARLPPPERRAYP